MVKAITDMKRKKMLEPELRPEFIKEILNVQKDETIKVKNWDEHFGLN